MIRCIVVVLLSILSMTSIASEWKWEIHPRDDGSSIIVNSKDGYDTLSKAVNAVPKESWVAHVRVHYIARHKVFQEELHSYMSENYPEELQEALDSAGNMHNPKIVALRAIFREAVLSSSYVKNINAALSNRCELVTEASFEKFHINKVQSKPVYEAMLWLTTEECT